MKSCVVIDLDATIVETFGSIDTWDNIPYSQRNNSRVFNIKFDSVFMWGTKRPYTRSFLETCFREFDIVIVWSAGIHSYVHEIVEELFPQAPDYIWTRRDTEPCQHSRLNDNYHQKPLSKIFNAYPQIDTRRTLIIDDKDVVCDQDTLYHILIPAWEGEFDTLTKPDIALKQLSEWIPEVVKVADYKSVSTKHVFHGRS